MKEAIVIRIPLYRRVTSKIGKKNMRKPGIEPGPPPWEGGILATELLARTVLFVLHPFFIPQISIL